MRAVKLNAWLSEHSERWRTVEPVRPPDVRCSVDPVRIVASSEAAAFVRSRGGRLWVWIDPHGGLGGVSYVYLVAALEAPGTSRATRRMRSSRLPHRFRSFDGDGFDVLLSSGRYGTPDELHLELARFPKKHLKAFWNGAVFVGDDIRSEPPA